MSGMSRRAYLQLGTTGIAAAALSAMAGPAGAALGPNDKYDLLIKSGEVLDPSGPLRAKRDIGIHRGLIEAVEADIPAERALQMIDAAGRLVVPGLIDLHTHVYPYGSALGIPADETPRVFERFYRADPARTRDPGGTGLGLAIARWIVQQHRGEIGLESQPGRGTTVRVRLPHLT